MNRWVFVLGVIFIPLAGVPWMALADDGLQTLRGSVEVSLIACLISPCPPPIVALAVPGRKEKIFLTGDAREELVALEGVRVEVFGSFDAANPKLFNVKLFKVLPDERGSQLKALFIKVVGISYFGRLYGRQVTLSRAPSGNVLKYSCWGKGCTCSDVNQKIAESEVQKLYNFISTLKDEGERARCCDHPWTEINLDYYSEPPQKKITVPFDLLKIEEIFNPCTTLVAPFNPDDSGSEFRLGKQLYNVGLYGRAREALEQAIKLDPEHVAVEAHETLGDTYRMLRKYDDALQAYNRVVTLRPNEATAFLKIAAVHSELGRQQEAINFYRQALSLQPAGDTAGEAYANLGHIYSDLGLFNEAVDAFKEALRIDPDAKFTRYSLGKVFVRLGDTQTALEQYETLKNLKSKYADDLHITIYKEAVRRNPKDPEAHFNLGNAYYWARRDADAIEPYKQALRLKPDLELAHSRLGYSFSQLGRYQEAIQAFKEVIRINPRSHIDHINLGLAYFHSDQREKAIEHLKEAIRLNPDVAVAHNNMGYVLRHMGRSTEAIESLKQAIRLDPNQELSHFNLGMAYRSIGRSKDAVEAFREAVRLNPKNPDSQFNLGNAYSETKRYKEAIKAYHAAINVKPNFVEARYQLGATYVKLGNREAAMEVYEKLKVWDKKRAEELYRLISK